MRGIKDRSSKCLCAKLSAIFDFFGVLKHVWEHSRREFSGAGEIDQGGSLIGGDFPGGSFPDTGFINNTSSKKNEVLQGDAGT